MALWHTFEQVIDLSPAASFSLRSIQGEIVSSRRYRNRFNLVLLFLGEVEGQVLAALLDQFISRQHRYRSKQAVPLIILSGQPQTDRATASDKGPSIPLLLDPGGKTRRRYEALLPEQVRDDALVFLLDRYNAPFAARYCHLPAEASFQEELLEWVDFIELQCPE